jgi:germination protein M
MTTTTTRRHPAHPGRVLSVAVLAALVLAAALTACGAGETEVSDVGAVPEARTEDPAPAPGVPAPHAAGTDQTAVVPLALVRGERIVWIDRRVPDAHGEVPALAHHALVALATGPTAAEAADGISSAVPLDTRVLGVSIGSDRIADVDLSREFESGGGTLSMTMRLAQVACTLDNLTELDDIDGVRFALDGRPVEVFSGEGVILDGPVSCADYGHFLR